MLSSSEAFSPSTWDHRGTSFSSSLCHKDMQKGPTMESSTTPAESSNSGRTVAYQAAHESSSGSGSGSAGGGGGGGGGGGASSSQTPREPAAPRPKRTVVHVACTCCRRLRIKCDGNRPTCAPCARRYEDCVYDVEANTTRSNALKRKNEDLAKEVSQLNELYAFLRDRPLIEAEEIFRRIRTTEDPLEVLRHVVTADLLMAQGSSLKPHSTTRPQERAAQVNSHDAARSASTSAPTHNNR